MRHSSIEGECSPSRTDRRMSDIHYMRDRARPLLLVAAVALTLGSCQAQPIDRQSPTVDGLRLVYDVIESAKVTDHP